MVDFVVYEVDNSVHVCGVFYVWDYECGEIVVLVVDDIYGGMGIGKKIVFYFFECVCWMRMKVVFVLMI